MSDIKRCIVKYVRDFIKKDYAKDTKCYICESVETLEFHHIYSVSELFNMWCQIKEIDLTEISVEDITRIREPFYEQNREELDKTVTLCKKHHLLLHTLYGQRYSNYIAKKVERWLDIQKSKFNGVHT